MTTPGVGSRSGAMLTPASPRMGSTPQASVATSARVTTRSSASFTTVRPSASRSVLMARLRTMTSVGPELIKPPVVVLAAAATVASSSAYATPWACKRAGSGRTSMRRTPPPMLRISAMPGMPWRRRRMVQSASVRTSAGARWPGWPAGVAERTPTSRISPMSEATGVMNGVTPSGSCSRAASRRSCTRVRAAWMSVPQPNSA